MLAWGVPDAELDPLIQYVKAFSPRWQTEPAGDAIVAGPDPWTGREPEGVERGKAVYHGLAQCAVACHPAYATKSEIYGYAKALTGNASGEFRGDLYYPVAKDSDYGVKILPPDFTFNELRGGDGLPDIYRAIAAGIGGTAMPTWKNVLPEPDLWAMAHYVRSLVFAARNGGRVGLAEAAPRPASLGDRRGRRLDQTAASTRGRPCLTPAGESALCARAAHHLPNRDGHGEEHRRRNRARTDPPAAVRGDARILTEAVGAERRRRCLPSQQQRDRKYESDLESRILIRDAPGLPCRP